MTSRFMVRPSIIALEISVYGKTFDHCLRNLDKVL
jgi:hypothetical protein